MPPKIRCDRASAVSAGCPKVLPRNCAPSRAPRLQPQGWMKTTAPSAAAACPADPIQEAPAADLGPLGRVDASRRQDLVPAAIAWHLADGVDPVAEQPP